MTKRSRTVPMPRLLLAAVAVLAGCGGGAPETGAAGEADAPALLGSPSRLLAVGEGLASPRAVLHDREQDVYFVSNAGAAPGDSTGGFISRVRPDGTIEAARFIEGGRGGARLASPRGMAIIGRTLWVADPDALRAFNRFTGEPAGGIELAATGVRRLQGLVVGPGGGLYATEAATDRVLRVRSAMDITFPLGAGELETPEAILWDSAGGRFLIGNARGGALLRWEPDDSTTTVAARTDGALRGLVLLSGGEILVSGGAGSVLLVGDTLRPLIRDVAGVAGLGVDLRRNRLLLPRAEAGVLEIWDLAGDGRR